MNASDEATRSVWMEVPVADASPLVSSGRADAVVVGSGIAGLSAAYELVNRGREVTVLDRGRIGGGMTARTTAHLASALDDLYFELIKDRGADCARMLHQCLAAAIDRVEAITRRESIDCDFRRLDGYWILAPNSPASALDDELAACARLGIPVEDRREPTPLHVRRLVRSLRFPGQARIHPTRYLAGLAAAIVRRGGRLHADSCVESIDQQQDEMVVRTASGHELRATDVVVATNSPVNLRVAIHTKQAPYRTYVVAATLRRGVLPDALYWDTLDPYHYVRLQPLTEREDLVIVGGADHKSGEANDGADRFAALEDWARARLPELGAVTYRWSGQVLEPIDGVGFIGPSPDSEHVYLVSGDSGQGISNGIVAGMMIGDLVTTGASPWQELYDPGRKVGSRIGTFISENITPLKNFAEYLSASDAQAAEGLAPGEGCIVRSGLAKVAACRDRDGRLHLRSASCTHLGCVVHWNSLEQCWDCPCHGSQFAPDGTALNGPAVSPLARVEFGRLGEAAE